MAQEIMANYSVGAVRSTKITTLHPMETKTATGFNRKKHNNDAAVAEPFHGVVDLIL